MIALSEVKKIIFLKASFQRGFGKIIIPRSAGFMKLCEERMITFGDPWGEVTEMPS